MVTTTFPNSLPKPRTLDPMAAPPLRWGVLGTGWIAERFTEALRSSTRQQMVAIGSRSVASATEFADQVGVGRAHGSYSDLVADPDVDIVYVATPHNFHHKHALLAIEAGKHVLVEKPIALNAAQAQEIADRAAERGVYCAEALWTFYLPRYDVVRQLLADGVLGEVHTVLADNGEWFPETHRILRPDLAGGPLLDLGTYAIALALWVLGEPEEAFAVAQDVPGGQVHGQVSATLRHPGGAMATINTTVMADTPIMAVLAGTHATLVIEAPFYMPGDLTLTSAGMGSTLRWTEPAIAHRALYVTAVEAARQIAAGQIGTPLRPLTDSIATLRVIDDIRRQIDVVFPGERRPGEPANSPSDEI
jgi:predicted dehydrogenase